MGLADAQSVKGPCLLILCGSYITASSPTKVVPMEQHHQELPVSHLVLVFTQFISPRDFRGPFIRFSTCSLLGSLSHLTQCLPGPSEPH